MTTYFPPLNLVAQKLFGSVPPRETIAAMSVPAKAMTVPSLESLPRTDVELPHAIANMIARGAESAAQASEAAGEPAAPRDIRMVRSVIDASGSPVRDLAAPAAVLLDHANSDGSWRAWMVSAETSYLSDRDLLIEHGDGPADPSAGVVQLWNQINVRLEKEALLLGRLTIERLELIRTLASSPGALRVAAVNVEPGRVGVVTLESGDTVTTGAPIRDHHDERHDLQDLYRRFGAELNAHAAHAGSEQDNDASATEQTSASASHCIEVTLRPDTSAAALLQLMHAMPDIRFNATGNDSIVEANTDGASPDAAMRRLEAFACVRSVRLLR